MGPISPSCPAEMLGLLRLGMEPGLVSQLPIGMGHVQPSTQSPHKKADSSGLAPLGHRYPTDIWLSLPDLLCSHLSLPLSGSQGLSCSGHPSGARVHRALPLPGFQAHISICHSPELPLSLVELPWGAPLRREEDEEDV